MYWMITFISETRQSLLIISCNSGNITPTSKGLPYSLNEAKATK